MPQSLRAKRPTKARSLAPRQDRISPRKRGYSARWDRASLAYRTKHPFCAWCEQVGRQRFADVVDHKIPVTAGGEMFEPSNWWGLCTPCHGRKAEMEQYARRTGETLSLKVWCDDPAARPARFREPVLPT